ncbi:MAG: 16S rRNA (guanine(527)-N(7))-methyltransferase RsmG [Acholeplasmatales bacterium]|nr:MAG: 16S rRNA (guanine(527)-N(7))-methyltransferase RsmG [Acholeplasmatales bacterium]
MDYPTFSKWLNALNIPVNPEQFNAFNTYYDLLVDWNKKMNLTAITERDDVFIKHFYDALSLIQAFPKAATTLLDVGSGAGFPSIPIKIMLQSLNVTIVESSGKRVRFLETLISNLDIDVTLIEQRIEAFKHKETFDIVTARAVASLNTLAELCLPFVKIGGVLLAPKGKGYREELALSQHALSELGAKHVETIEVHYQDYERVILVIKKYTHSPSKYPRNFARIKKNPL